MNLPQDLRYAKTHEWVRLEGHIATVGITDFAQSQLNDLTYVELPAVGAQFKAGQEAAVVESVKAASDIYAPLAGTVLEVNAALGDSPELVNKAPYGQGWLFKLHVSAMDELSSLLTDAQYAALVPQD